MFGFRNRALPRKAQFVLGFALAIFAASCDGGDSAPPAAVGVEVGNEAPPLEGILASGEPFALVGDGASRTLLVFYRGGYCGLCRERLRRLQEHLSGYAELGVRVVAVTADSLHAIARTREATGAEFPIVSVDSTTLRQWNLFDAEHQAPASGTVIVDSDGIILFRHVGQSASDQIGDAALVAKLEQGG